MRAEDLIDSLECVGDDLLAETERTFRIRKGRPWLGAAAAAVLVLGMAFGGYALWRNMETGLHPASDPPRATMSGAAQETSSSAESEVEPIRDGPKSLDAIRIGDNWTGVSVRSFDDIERAMRANPWKEGNYDTLPVFRNLAYRGDSETLRYYSAAELTDLAEDAAGRLGVKLSRREIRFDMPDDGASDPGCPAEATVDTDQGTLIVEGDGTVMFLFDEAHRIQADPAYYTVEGPAELTEEDRDYAMHTGVVRSWMEQLQPILQMPDYGIAPHPRHEQYLSSWDAWSVYPLRGRPWDQFLSYSFEQVRLLTVDGTTLEGIVISRWPPEGGFQKDESCEPPAPWLESLGGYPLISPEQAKECLEKGNYLTEVDILAMCGPVLSFQIEVNPGENPGRMHWVIRPEDDPNLLPDTAEDIRSEISGYSYIISADGKTWHALDTQAASWMELVYPTEAPHELLIPFYRFWIQTNDSAQTGRYAAVYVPAILNCSDFEFAHTETQPSASDDVPEWDLPVQETAEGPGSEPATEVPETTLPEPTAIADPMELPDLPVLSLESGFRHGDGEEIVSLEDVNANLAVSPWRKDPGRPYTALTAFRNLAWYDEAGMTLYYDEENLRFRVENLAAALHLSILSSDLDHVTVERDGKTVTLPAQLTAKTDFGTIVITGDGTTRLLFDEPQSIDRFVSLHTGPGEHVDLPEYRDESALDFAQAWIAYLLNLDGRLIQRSDGHSFIELRQSSLEDTVKEESVPSAGDPDAQSRKPRSFRWWRHNLDEEAPLQYTFGGTITLDENGMLTLFTMDADANEEIGEYPIISPEDADNLLREGRYLSTVRKELLPDGCLGGLNLVNRAVKKELVYCTGGMEELFLPFYRYWIPLVGAELQEGMTSYGAFYVPAVREEYLSDWPKELMPAELSSYRSTLTELRDWFSGSERQAQLCTDAQSELILDSWIHGAEDDVIQLRYWCGRDKMIPWSADLRKTENGWEVLSKTPSTWNQFDAP